MCKNDIITDQDKEIFEEYRRANSEYKTPLSKRQQKELLHGISLKYIINARIKHQEEALYTKYGDVYIGSTNAQRIKLTKLTYFNLNGGKIKYNFDSFTIFGEVLTPGYLIPRKVKAFKKDVISCIQKIIESINIKRGKVAIYLHFYTISSFTREYPRGKWEE